jgi:ribosomal protein L16/L10AE
MTDYVKIEGADELDAAQRLMKIPLQRTARPDMYIRAFVHHNVTQGAPIKIYAAEAT